MLCRNWTKGPLPAAQAGLIALSEPKEKKKAFGLLRAKGNTEEKKFHVEHWRVLCRNWTKGPLPAAQAGLIALSEPKEKKKASGLLRAKGNTEEKKFHVEHWKVLYRELRKRPLPCQTGRADFLG